VVSCASASRWLSDVNVVLLDRRTLVIRTLGLAAPAATLALALVAGGCAAPAETTSPAPAETASAATAFEIPYPSLAARIVTSLRASQGERVLLRDNPGALGPLEPEVRRQLEAKGAVVESLQYGE